ncbi:MAG TPA: Spy/CpxP family protein refolding chaperone [Xanthobacteraceae bacterium]|nr:Spy/CpxP family protein refolding chaperone [Xanthobacteraceae bacterium]
MWKKILVGATALTITASMAALAQPQGNRGEAFRRGAPTAEDMQAFADARLAALKAGLSLTEQQAANWPAFEEAVRAWQKLRMDRRAAQAGQRNNTQAEDPAERLRRQGTAMADTGAALKKLGDSLDALYKSLDDNQKRRFAALSPIGGPRYSFAAPGGRDDGRPGFRGRNERDTRGERFGRNFRGHGFHDGRDAYGYDSRESGRGLRGRGGYSPDDQRRGPDGPSGRRPGRED